LKFHAIDPTSLVKPAALQQLGADPSQFKIGIAIIAKTWFSALHTDQLVKIDGYNLFRKHRVGKKGGGVAIYVRDDIKYAIKLLCLDSCSSSTEVLWVECIYLDTTNYIAACYPPKARYREEVLKDELSSDLEMLLNGSSTAMKTPVIVIAGDFNSLNTEFLESDFGLVQVVDKKTHGSHIIDKFFTSRPDISRFDSFASLIKTKHQVVYVEMNCSAEMKTDHACPS
jgi:hypothetical protein